MPIENLYILIKIKNIDLFLKFVIEYILIFLTSEISLILLCLLDKSKECTFPYLGNIDSKSTTI